jgi:pimeloyl-ACP methyl ester carboxylesterase
MSSGPATPRAELWRERGSYFTWQPDEPGVGPVQVFHIETGEPDVPVMLLVHGFPTSSIDWFEIADPLTERFRVCALDFPGYGFSDKPRGWGYTLTRDAELLSFYLEEIVGAEAAVVLAHDRGDSVALIHAERCANGSCPVRLERLFLTNGNMFLPLSTLTPMQHLLLDATTAPQMLANLTAQVLAAGMGAATFTPPRGGDDPVVEALETTFAHDNGVAVLHETIQYLVERAADEQTWLEGLAASNLPTTVIWGLNDTVAPPRVPMFIWERYLMFKPGRNSLYFVPEANHYLQNDRPEALVAAVFHAMDSPELRPPGAIDETSDAPLLIDCSREGLPDAAEVIAVPPGLAERLKRTTD